MDRGEAGAPTSIRCEQRRLKRQLFTVLEDRCYGWREYWSSLQRFAAGRLAKAELDAHVHRLLGAENLPLHNAFVLAVIRGACFVPAPALSRATGECRAKNTWTNAGILNRCGAWLSERKCSWLFVGPDNFNGK